MSMRIADRLSTWATRRPPASSACLNRRANRERLPVAKRRDWQAHRVWYVDAEHLLDADAAHRVQRFGKAEIAQCEIGRLMNADRNEPVPGPHRIQSSLDVQLEHGVRPDAEQRTVKDLGCEEEVRDRSGTVIRVWPHWGRWGQASNRRTRDAAAAARVTTLESRVVVHLVIDGHSNRIGGLCQRTALLPGHRAGDNIPEKPGTRRQAWRWNERPTAYDLQLAALTQELQHGRLGGLLTADGSEDSTQHGGARFPFELTGRTFSFIGHLLPSAWAMDGFQNLVLRGQGFGSALVQAAVITVCAMLFFAVAVWRFRAE